MRGRKPTPTALKRLHGNPGQRPLPVDEPKPQIEIPELPTESGLGKIGEDEYQRITQHLYQLSMIADMDIAVVVGYCHSFEQFIISAEQLKKSGYLVKAPSGYPMVNPLISINNEAKRQMLKYAQELGLTVVQRARIRTPQVAIDIDPIDRFLK